MAGSEVTRRPPDPEGAVRILRLIGEARDLIRLMVDKALDELRKPGDTISDEAMTDIYAHASDEMRTLRACVGEVGAFFDPFNTTDWALAVGRFDQGLCPKCGGTDENDQCDDWPKGMGLEVYEHQFRAMNRALAFGLLLKAIKPTEDTKLHDSEYAALMADDYCKALIADALNPENATRRLLNEADALVSWTNITNEEA